MKIAIFSDLHIHNYKRFDVNGSRLLNCLSALSSIFWYCHNTGIRHIVFGGDLFDQKKALPTEVINATAKAFSLLFSQHPDIEFYAISGNHDHATKNLYDNPCEHSLTWLSYMFPNNFTVIDNGAYRLPEVTIYGIPYYQTKEDFDKALQRAKGQLLFIHQTPYGIKNKFIHTDVDPSDFMHFKHVFCGHIHQHEKLLDNFTVIGSPLHRDFGDVGEDNGFLVYDTQTNTFVRELLGLPKFEKVQTITEESQNYQQEIVQEIEQHTDLEQYDNSKSHSELVTNYWKDNSEDEQLLNVGKSLL